jgi:phosphate-selective porin OprO/OprP
MNRKKESALGAVALGIIASLQATTALGEDTTATEIHLLKARLRQLEAKVAKQDREQKETKARVANVANAAAAPVCKDAPCPPPPPPVFVSFKNGLFVESLDHAFSFKVGGRVFVDGGASMQPERGYAGVAGINQARLEVEGRAFKYWRYKLQYDFAGSNTFTTSGGATTTPAGGIRDAYIALTYFDPITFQVGNFFEPMGLERLTSKTVRPFIENAMLTDSFAASRHIGVAALTHGENWSAKGGFFSTSLEDKALTPTVGIPVPPWVTSKAGWAATGGGQYFDASGRITYAPIMESDRLLHIGLLGRYHRPNDATGVNDDRVLLLGSNTNAESSVLRENLLGTPDLSCGTVAFFGNPAVAGKCVRDVQTYGAELSAVYGPFTVQAEYMDAHYNRKAGSILLANLAGNYAPGGTSLDFNSYYVYGTLFLTGETRASAYQVTELNPGAFGPVKIKSPFSAGGWGAFEIGARFSVMNLNNGPFQGAYFSNLLALAPNTATRLAVANASVLGGREENLTVGLNWYPDPGFRVMANWTRVMHLTAPWDRPYLNGAHPNIFLVRTMVYW